jgi:hypothetical protein
VARPLTSGERAAKKRALFEIFPDNHGDVHDAARQVGVHPATVARWLLDDEELAAAKDRAERLALHRIEASVISQAIAGDKTCQLFSLKCRSGDRWQERRTVTHKGSIDYGGQAGQDATTRDTQTVDNLIRATADTTTSEDG